MEKNFSCREIECAMIQVADKEQNCGQSDLNLGKIQFPVRGWHFQEFVWDIKALREAVTLVNTNIIQIS